MKLDLSKIKKVKETPKEATFQHGDGHRVILNKSGLDKDQMKSLSSMPLHYAGDEDKPEDSQVPELEQLNTPTEEVARAAPKLRRDYLGEGEIDPEAFRGPPMESLPLSTQTAFLKEQNQAKEREQNQSVQEDKQNKAQIDAYNAEAAKAGLPLKSTGENQPSSPVATSALDQSPIAPVPAVKPAEDVGGNVLGQYQGAVSGYQRGLQQEAAARGELGKQQANILNPAIQQQQQAMQSYNDRIQKYSDQYDKFIQDYQNQHIDPNHYLNSMGTGQKVATGIGLILGGMGSGLTGQPNAAMEFLNKQIANDVDAQKAEMGKKENLLTANYRQFGNMNEASKMTQAMQQGIVSNQLAQAAALAQDPIAKARAMQASSKFKMDSLMTIRQLALQQEVLGQLKSPAQGGTQDPASRITAMQMAGLANPEEAKEASKSLTAVKNHAQQRDNIIDSFDKASQENTIAGRIGRLGYNPPSVGVLQSAMMPYLKDAEGRINEQELIRTDKLIPSAGDRPDTVKEKRQGLIQFLQEKEPDMGGLNKFGINPEQFGKYNRYGKSKIELKPPVR